MALCQAHPGGSVSFGRRRTSRGCVSGCLLTPEPDRRTGDWPAGVVVAGLRLIAADDDGRVDLPAGDDGAVVERQVTVAVDASLAKSCPGVSRIQLEGYVCEEPVVEDDSYSLVRWIGVPAIVVRSYGNELGLWRQPQEPVSVQVHVEDA